MYIPKLFVIIKLFMNVETIGRKTELMKKEKENVYFFYQDQTFFIKLFQKRSK